MEPLTPTGPPSDLLDCKKNVFSQNGEDGIIEELFRRIGVEASTCCEFGAWDGKHLSNCRKLILEGWKALMIEAEAARYQELVETYRDNPAVVCVNRIVDDGKNSLGTIVKETGFAQALDFLSIDIDGLDSEIFTSLDLRPRVICVEINAAFHPTEATRLPREVAAASIGQPMCVFAEIATGKGYGLVCYSSNAFYVRNDIVEAKGLKVLAPQEAYDSFLQHLEPEGREWLWIANAGLVPPYRKYHNPLLSAGKLQLPLGRRVGALQRALSRLVSHGSGYLRHRLSQRR